MSEIMRAHRWGTNAKMIDAAIGERRSEGADG